LSITINDVKEKLLTLDTVRETLERTEPLDTYEFEVGGNSVAFKLEDEFNHGLKALKNDEVVSAYITVSGKELQLTRDSLYQFASEAYMSKGFVQNSSAHIVAEQLNEQFGAGLAGKDYKVLAVNGNKAAAMTRGALVPYSNLRLLQTALDGIEGKYGKGEVFADYKFTHTLEQTHIRLIVPEYVRVIENTGTENDTWSVGIQIKNSLVGDEQTEILGYLFRYWCTNGAIDTANSANSVWSRRGAGGKTDAVYEWAADAVDEVLGGLEGSLDLVQGMTDISIEGTAVEALRDVFTTWRISTADRQRILNNMVNEDNMTMYALMQAVTQAANIDGVSAANVDRLMRAGGDLPLIANDRCGSCHRFLEHTH
jgi:hypothetical protein